MDFLAWLKHLMVTGGAERLQYLTGPNVTLLGRQPDEVVADYMARARALVFAADKDFGIVPVEAQAAGVFFYEQAPEAVQEAVERFLAVEGCFEPEVLRANSERFSRERFLKDFGEYVLRKWEEFAGARRG